MKKLIPFLFIASLTASLPVASETLVFANVNAKTAPINTGFLNDWVDRINESGAVDIKTRFGPSLVNYTNFYDRVIDGVADVSFGVSVFNPGRFPKSLIFTMPFIIESAEQGSLAACKMYESGAFDGEFDDIKPLLFMQFANSTLHTKSTPLNSMEAIDGMKLIVTAPPAVDVVKASGGQALSIDIGDAYQALQRGTADGMVISYTAFETFQLGDQLKHHYSVPLGGALAVVFISRDRYNSLDSEAKIALDSNSGCEESRKFGAYVDVWEQEERDELAKIQGKNSHQFTEVSADVLSSLQTRFKDEFLQKFSDNLPDGQQLVDAFLQALEQSK